MLKLFPVLVFFLATLSLGGCGEQQPDSTEAIVMGQGQDWAPQDCDYLFNLDLPPQTRICGVVGGGDRPRLDVALSRSDPFEQAGLVTVEVNSPGAPVVLLLSDYQSTLWRIESTPGTEVLAAAVSGYEPQEITGLGPEALRIINYYGRGNKPCPRFDSNDPRTRQSLAKFMRKNTGRKPDFIAEIKDGRAVCGWPSPPGAELLSHGDFNQEEFEAFADYLAELTEALESGLIRKAGQADLKKYKEARSLNGRLREAETRRELPRDAYVVESRNFVFPAGLHRLGERSSDRVFTFIIPPGLPLPEGPFEGLRVLFMDDGGCLGLKCGQAKAVYSASDQTGFPLPDLKLPPECRLDGLKLPEGTGIFAGGAYKGRAIAEKKTNGSSPTRATGYYPHYSGWRSASKEPEVGRIDVTVNSPDFPAVLMLGAYEPVEWHFDIKPGTEVAAVVLSGYHPQKLIGLPAEIPVVGGTSGERRCWGFYFSRENFVRINQISENLFGRKPERGFLAVDGKLLIDPNLPPREITPEGLKRMRLEWKTDNPAIDEAIAKGWLRPASSESKNAWFRKRAEKAGWTNLMEPADFVYAPAWPAFEIVSDEFVFPEIKGGASMIDFYLPEDMELPEKIPAGATIHFMDDGSCLGGRGNCGNDS